MGSLPSFTVSGIISEISFFYLAHPKSNTKHQEDQKMGLKANADICTALLFSLPVTALAVLTLHVTCIQVLTAFI